MELHDKGLVLSAPEIPGEPSAPFLPYLFRLAGKDRGEKGRWVTIWCVLRVRFREALFFGLCEHT
ncbi:MAG: hypothetical protein ACLTLM_04415 [Oscillospiraceae bacterium]